MKYSWNEMTESQKALALKRELELITHNGTSKDDLLNILRWLSDKFEIGTKGPQIVCLCGSTRFYKTFDEQNFKLTLAGKIVLSIGCNTKSDEGLNLTSEDKVRLDELHKRKIDLSDRILVLNVGGYIGDSTRSEIEYARKIGKPIDYLEQRSEGVAERV